MPAERSPFSASRARAPLHHPHRPPPGLLLWALGSPQQPGHALRENSESLTDVTLGDLSQPVSAVTVMNQPQTQRSHRSAVGAVLSWGCSACLAEGRSSLCGQLEPGRLYVASFVAGQHHKPRVDRPAQALPVVSEALGGIKSLPLSHLLLSCWPKGVLRPSLGAKCREPLALGEAVVTWTAWTVERAGAAATFVGPSSPAASNTWPCSHKVHVLEKRRDQGTWYRLGLALD